MRMYDIIEKKKQGLELDYSELRFWIDGVVNNSIPDYQTTALLMAICFRGMTDEETYTLTRLMCDSGDKLDVSIFDGIVVDKHSTGGVGDSVSFVTMPIMAALGYKCCKLSGRGLGHTGGTIDKLESLPGLVTEGSIDLLIERVRKCGFAIMAQNLNIAPCDKRLYALRDVTCTVNSIPLIASSIMSKKLAVAADRLVLDVKCGEGAFMTEVEDARRLATAMVDIGKRDGVLTTAVITDMNQPLDNYIGNSLELLGAIKVLKGESNRLKTVSLALCRELLPEYDDKTAYAKCEEVISNGKAYECLVRGLVDAGANIEDITLEKLAYSNYKSRLIADKSGYISKIIPSEIGKLLTALGGGRVKVGDKIDHQVGIEMKVRVGDSVKAGDCLAVLHHSKQEDVSYLDILKKYIIIGEKPAALPEIIDIIR